MKRLKRKWEKWSSFLDRLELRVKRFLFDSAVFRLFKRDYPPLDEDRILREIKTVIEESIIRDQEDTKIAPDIFHVWISVHDMIPSKKLDQHASVLIPEVTKFISGYGYKTAEKIKISISPSPNLEASKLKVDPSYTTLGYQTTLIPYKLVFTWDGGTKKKTIKIADGHFLIGNHDSCDQKIHFDGTKTQIAKIDVTAGVVRVGGRSPSYPPACNTSEVELAVMKAVKEGDIITFGDVVSLEVMYDDFTTD